MKGFWAIFKRELGALFVTPLAWVLITSFLLLQGLHFFWIVSQFAGDPAAAAGSGPIETFFGQTVLLYPPLLVVCPLLTMRLLAEERRSGTIEPLLAAPVGAAAVVLGKYAATLVTYLAMWAPTVGYVVLLGRYGEVDWPVALAGYLGVATVGAGYLAVGTMTSALTRSQLTAATLSALVLIGLFTLGVGEFIVDEGPVRELSAYVSLWGHMNDFARGIVDSRRLVLQATLVAFPLFVAVRAVDSWRLE
ncbi:MAG: ABC transporter permease [Deltaproteobacteria bacterium]|nr:ABC transporter permease [Deltaproteobacteria bacterium]